MSKTVRHTSVESRLSLAWVIDRNERTSRHNADFKRGPLWKGKDNELFPCACAMAEVALDLNPAIRPLYVDIIRAWEKPGCANFAPNTEIEQWVNDFPSSQNSQLFCKIR